MADCKHCQEVNRTVSIQNPLDLTRAIRVIRDNLIDGTLQQSSYWPSDQIGLDEPIFSDLPDHEPWPDYMHYFFQCPQCQRIFELSVETYRGAGGKWSAIES